MVKRGRHTVSPGPFDLGDRITRIYGHPSQGVFERMYLVRQLAPDEVERMALWLCHNCTQNFIFTENSSRILAGGSTNPLLSWQRRHTDRGAHSVGSDGYYIKLDREDTTFFELSWLHGNGGRA